MNAKLTVGFAHFDDPRAGLTLKSLAMNHELRGINFVVVDNSPNSKLGENLRSLCRDMANGGIDLKYVPMPENTGTTQPRNRIFAEATGEAVLVMDCHVVPAAGSLQRLIRYYDEHPDCLDLMSGPLLYNDGRTIETHFADQWRSEMWGTWATDKRGIDPEAEPFDIFAQGLGLFTCRRSAWLGFNEHFRGFGGEEGYIHEKFRKAGRRVLCLPFLRWWHDFSRWNPTGQVQYPLSRYDRVRNYVLGAQELGLPTLPIYNHFVNLNSEEHLAKHLVEEHGYSVEDVNGKSDEELMTLHARKKITAAAWDYLLANPVAHEKPPQATAASAGMPITIDSLYALMSKAKRDVDQHMPELKELASHCDRVEEITRRIESTAGLLAGKPKQMRTRLFGPDIDKNVFPPTPGFTLETSALFQQWDIDDCDLLFFKTDHEYLNLGADLERWEKKVKRWIVLHDTENAGETWGNGKPGLWEGLIGFLANHPEWFIASHTTKQFGLTILSRNDADRPADEITPWPPNFGPGTECGLMLAEIGISTKRGCGCKARMEQMDRWGVAGCRERFDTIVEWLRAGQDKWSWTEKFTAASKAAANGLAWKVNWLDPIPGIVTEAIRRAEEKEKPTAAPNELQIFFDVDGVLNDTPARGKLGFGVDQDKCDRLMRIPGKKVCIGWARSQPETIKLPFEYTLAPNGEKRNCWKGASIIIDDDRSLYQADAPLYITDGRVGLTDQDVANILAKLNIAPLSAPVTRRSPPSVRNLIYHVCPFAANDGWRRNVDNILQRAEIFNGKRIIAIATGAGLESPQVVKDAFGPGNWRFIEVPNDKRLREVASFELLLLAIAGVDANEATFYAHTKGNSTAESLEGSTYWRNAMYRHLLDRWQECMTELETHTFVGTHKMNWTGHPRSPFPTAVTLDKQIGKWMHAGTFFWFRNDTVFNHPNWQAIPQDRYGAEAWPSIVCPDPRQAKSMFQPWDENVYPTANPYDPAIYTDPIPDPAMQGAA